MTGQSKKNYTVPAVDENPSNTWLQELQKREKNLTWNNCALISKQCYQNFGRASSLIISPCWLSEEIRERGKK